MPAYRHLETWRFIDTVDVAGGLTYVAYCPIGYEPGMSDEPRPGCDLIDRMHKQLEVLQLRRVEEAITNGDLFQIDVGENPLEPANPELVAQVLARDTYRPNNFGEYFDLANHVEMARFHMEILSRICDDTHAVNVLPNNDTKPTPRPTIGQRHFSIC